MATNKSTIKALHQLSTLLSRVILTLRKGRNPRSIQVDKIEAGTRLLQKHLKAQRAQGGRYPKDTYRYDKVTKKLQRKRGGQVVSSV